MRKPGLCTQIFSCRVTNAISQLQAGILKIAFMCMSVCLCVSTHKAPHIRIMQEALKLYIIGIIYMLYVAQIMKAISQ